MPLILWMVLVSLSVSTNISVLRVAALSLRTRTPHSYAGPHHTYHHTLPPHCTRTRTHARTLLPRLRAARPAWRALLRGTHHATKLPPALAPSHLPHAPTRQQLAPAPPARAALRAGRMISMLENGGDISSVDIGWMAGRNRCSGAPQKTGARPLPAYRAPCARRCESGARRRRQMTSIRRRQACAPLHALHHTRTRTAHAKGAKAAWRYQSRGGRLHRSQLAARSEQ